MAFDMLREGLRNHREDRVYHDRACSTLDQKNLEFIKISKGINNCQLDFCMGWAYKRR